MMYTLDILNSLARMKWYLEKGDYASLQIELEDRLRVVKEHYNQEIEEYRNIINRAGPVGSRLLSKEEWSEEDEADRMKYKYGRTEDGEEMVAPL